MNKDYSSYVEYLMTKAEEVSKELKEFGRNDVVLIGISEGYISVTVDDHLMVCHEGEWKAEKLIPTEILEEEEEEEEIDYEEKKYWDHINALIDEDLGK